MKERESLFPVSDISEVNMEPKNYVVTKIEGEYAYLTDEEGNELFIALALLPPGTDTGTRLHYEFPEYTIL